MLHDRSHYVFTSESVSEGHPDKISDQISDAILDYFLTRDPEARVALETLTTTNRVVLAGEVRSHHAINQDALLDVARNVVKDIGYEQEGFHWKDLEIDCFVHEQSADIAAGVDAGENKEEGAGDQGIMFGYAVDETPELMPAPIHYAHRILKRLSDDRKSGKVSFLRPDSKSQISLAYENGKPVHATTVVVSTQHEPDCSQKILRDYIRSVVEEILPQGWMCPDEDLYVNPTGQFIIGGPDGDAGLTGRKIIVDTYGGAAPHGGGAFSGKDPTKVDRSAAYAARYLAKNIVAAGLASKCSIQLSYAIGVSKPLSIYVNTYGSATCDESKIEEAITKLMDLSPRGIRTHLKLNAPIYLPTAAYGHFGRSTSNAQEFTWEKLDLIDQLKTLIGA